jgi:hypothetical protein
MQQHKDMWHLWLRKPFEDWTMATKSLKEIIVERENLDLHHVPIIYNKLSTFIVQAIWPLKYIFIKITRGFVLYIHNVWTTCNNALWDRMNAFIANNVMKQAREHEHELVNMSLWTRMDIFEIFSWCG